MTSEEIQNDLEEEKKIRPQYLNDFLGQDDAVENLEVAIRSACKRNDTIDHVLIYGPPGLGKTTLAGIIANEMGTNFKSIISTSIKQISDLLSVLVKLKKGDILFIDEIHRLPYFVEETLYPAMEDYKVNIVVDEENIVDFHLNKFTLIGATTNPGMLTRPFQDRFHIKLNLELYNEETMVTILKNMAPKFGVIIDDNDILLNIAKRCRGTPRIAVGFMRRIRDEITISDKKKVDIEDLNRVFKRLKIQENGLNEQDKKYLAILESKKAAVGLKTIASVLGEDERTVEENIEPYLLRMNLIEKTNKGRILKKENEKDLFTQ